MHQSVGPAAEQPVLPAYGGACIASITPVLQQIVSGEAPDSSSPLPDWLPEPVRDATQIVLLVLDGVGWTQLQRPGDVTPTLSSGTGGPITSVAPTTTATALTSISTGLVPADHGLVGYRLAVGEDGAPPVEGSAKILNVLRWQTEDGDARMSIPAREFQPARAFCGGTATTVTRAEFLATGFSAAHLDGPSVVGWQVPSTIVVETRRRLREGARFVHTYYDGPDKVAHSHGLGEHYETELRATDRLVGDLVEVLPDGGCLVVTSDHGQVEVGTSAQLPANELLEASWLLSGEGRFRWFHARSGAERDLEQAALACHGEVAWVRTLEQMIDERWFGGPLSAVVASRLGDVALVAREPIAFLDPADTGETRLAARHGSLTAAEMYVPLLAFASI